MLMILFMHLEHVYQTNVKSPGTLIRGGGKGELLDFWNGAAHMLIWGLKLQGLKRTFLGSEIPMAPNEVHC